MEVNLDTTPSYTFDSYLPLTAWADPEGGGARGPDPPTKSILSNTGPDPLKSHKVTKPVFNVGPSSVRQRNAI